MMQSQQNTFGIIRRSSVYRDAINRVKAKPQCPICSTVLIHSFCDTNGHVACHCPVCRNNWFLNTGSMTYDLIIDDDADIDYAKLWAYRKVKRNSKKRLRVNGGETGAQIRQTAAIIHTDTAKPVA